MIIGSINCTASFQGLGVGGWANMIKAFSVLKVTASCKDKVDLYKIEINRNEQYMPC